MRKFFCYILFASLLCISNQAFANDSAMSFCSSGIEQEMNQPQINVTANGTFNIKNAEGLVLEIYSITGEKVIVHKIDSNNHSYEFSQLQKGWYIAKIGKVTRKFCIK